jgi:hypothetical protein
VTHALGEQLVAAIAGQDEAALEACFASGVEFRALIPPGLKERTGAPEAAKLISQWFSDCTQLELLDSQSDAVGDRLHVSYRFSGVEDGEAFVAEQHLFCIVSDRKIMRADLLCSGFRPLAAAGS